MPCALSEVLPQVLACGTLVCSRILPPTAAFSHACRHTLPAHLRMANLDELTEQQPHVLAREPGAGVPHESVNQLDAGLTWACLAWLRSFCSLPVLVKVLALPLRVRLLMQAWLSSLWRSKHPSLPWHANICMMSWETWESTSALWCPNTGDGGRSR